MEKQIYTLDEASEYFSVSTKTLAKYATQQIVPGFKMGREWRFTKADLEKGVENLRKLSNPPDNKKRKIA